MSLEISNSLNNFTFKLFQHVSAGKNENYFISPLSIVTALSMTLSGAKSETLNELKTLLNLQTLSSQEIFEMQNSYLKTLANLNDSVVLNVANRIYSKDGYLLQKEFTDNLAKHYQSEAQTVDFAKSAEAANTINTWVANKTNDKIKNLLDASLFNDLTRLVLVNAVYFKGKWLNQFDKTNTYKEDFTLRDGSVQKVDMMKLINKKFIFKINPGDLTACTCELPYIGETVSMTIILPHEGINIEDVEKQLNHQVLKEVFERNVEIGKVHLYVPKFKLDLKTELSEHLKSLGAASAFDADKADFSGVSTDSKGLCISNVVHQAVVEVGEEGTEAAAATAVVMMKRMAMMELPPEEFKCNRPFLFIIHDTVNHGILFFGKYMKP